LYVGVEVSLYNYDSEFSRTVFVEHHFLHKFFLPFPGVAGKALSPGSSPTILLCADVSVVVVSAVVCALGRGRVRDEKDILRTQENSKKKKNLFKIKKKKNQEKKKRKEKIKKREKNIKKKDSRKEKKKINQEKKKYILKRRKRF